MAHKWEFKKYFRKEAFGWKGSALAAKRLREASKEILKTGKKEPALAAEAFVWLCGRIWPAFCIIDTSSGSLSAAVDKELQKLVDFFSNAELPDKLRGKLLDRLFAAIVEDGVDYLSVVKRNWGDLCRTSELASAWVDKLQEDTVESLCGDDYLYFAGCYCCLSAMLKSGRHDQLLELLDNTQLKMWDYMYYGAEAIRERENIDLAIEYAQNVKTSNRPDDFVDAYCEELLLKAGRADEAYDRFAIKQPWGGTYLNAFRRVAKKYPGKDKATILNDLIKTTPSKEGKWFAVAKDLELFDLAVELAQTGPCNPGTLLRAVEKYQDENSSFAYGVAMAGLKHLIYGEVYETDIMQVDGFWSAVKTIAENDGSLQATVSALDNMINTCPKPWKFVVDILKKKLSSVDTGWRKLK